MISYILAFTVYVFIAVIHPVMAYCNGSRFDGKIFHKGPDNYASVLGMGSPLKYVKNYGRKSAWDLYPYIIVQFDKQVKIRIKRIKQDEINLELITRQRIELA